MYMAVSGLPERCNDHARKICNMALDMMEIVSEIRSHKRKIEVKLTAWLNARTPRVDYSLKLM